VFTKCVSRGHYGADSRACHFKGVPEQRQRFLIVIKVGPAFSRAAGRNAALEPAAKALERPTGARGCAGQAIGARLVDALESNPARDAVAHQLPGAVTLAQALAAPLIGHGCGDRRLAPSTKAGMAVRRAIAASAREATAANGGVHQRDHAEDRLADGERGIGTFRRSAESDLLTSSDSLNFPPAPPLTNRLSVPVSSRFFRASKRLAWKSQRPRGAVRFVFLLLVERPHRQVESSLAYAFRVV
jgi:hypothetical protein